MNIDSDKIFIEILEELRNMAKTNKENSIAIRQMAKYLKDFQSVIDFQLKDIKGMNRELIRDLKLQFTRMATMVDPDIVGAYRGNNIRWMSSDQNNAINTIDESVLLKYAENSANPSIIYNRGYYVTGYLLNLSSSYAPLNEGVTSLMASKQHLNILSSSASDKGTTPSGTGIQQLTLRGINTSGCKFSETITLDGRTMVTTVNQFAQIDTAQTAVTGTSGGAVGTITISGANDSTTYATISIGENQWRSGCFFTDIKAAAYVDQWSFSSYTNSVRAQLRGTNILGMGNYNALLTRASCIVQNFSNDVFFPLPIRISKQGLIVVRALSRNNNTEVNTSFQLHFMAE